jgi:thiamine-monophosphate kinase
MPLNEFDIIKKYFTRQSSHSTVVSTVGDACIGDDCAVVNPAQGKQLVMSMDTLVAGTHFPESATPYQIATRALCTSLSDLAAMGARPLWFTLGLTLPHVSEQWLSEFSRGLFVIADQFNVDLIGGDTTKGPLSVTVQVHGEVNTGAALMRSSAQAGDAVFVTDVVGDGAAALAMLQGANFLDDSLQKYLLARFYQPLPQIAVGESLAPLANAAIDISDGLLADAGHIARASNVVIQLDLEDIPVAEGLKNNTQCTQEQCWQWGLSGGDDYQLLFTMPLHHLEKLRGEIAAQDVTITQIGRVVSAENDQSKVVLMKQQQVCDVAHITNMQGYQHFDA